jgi:Flp pilus assembly protein TadG
MRRNRDKESGTTAIEFVVFTPLLFLLMFGSVQLGLALFAQHVAATAAQEGARTAREQAAGSATAVWTGNSQTAANNWVTQLLGHLVEGGPDFSTAFVKVPLTAPYPVVGVNVQFSVVSVVPWWTFTLSAQSVGPVECFYAPDGHCNGY